MTVKVVSLWDQILIGLDARAVEALKSLEVSVEATVVSATPNA